MERSSFFSIILLVAMGVASPLSAQATGQPNPAPAPSFGISLGFGSVLGWLGGGVEKYFSSGRSSVAVGLGYVPETDEGNPTFLAYGAGARRYFGSGAHRAAVELSVSMVSFEWISQGGVVLESHKHYGPGLAVGYRYTAGGGLHFDTGLGAGWAVGAQSVHPIGSLALGYTWRRRPS